MLAQLRLELPDEGRRGGRDSRGEEAQCSPWVRFPGLGGVGGVPAPINSCASRSCSVPSSGSEGAFSQK